MMKKYNDTIQEMISTFDDNFEDTAMKCFLKNVENIDSRMMENSKLLYSYLQDMKLAAQKIERKEDSCAMILKKTMGR